VGDGWRRRHPADRKKAADPAGLHMPPVAEDQSLPSCSCVDDK
jgi:hypothetical protein